MLSRRRYFLITLISAPAIFGKDVQVSVAGDSYGPSLITANVLDEIKISFTVGSASFTQSTFDQPCVPLAGGINSGPVTIPSGHGPQSFKFVLQTPDPLYFFSFFDNSTAQCKNGFVSSINASASQLTQFKASAENFNAVEPALQGPETSNLPKGPSPIPSPTSAEVINHDNSLPTSSQNAPPTTASDPRTVSFSLSSISRQSSTIPTESSSPSSSSHLGTLTSPSLPSSSTNGDIPDHPQPTSNPTPTATTGGTKNSSKSVAILGSLLGALMLVSVLIFVVFIRRRRIAHRYPSVDADQNSKATGSGFTSMVSRVTGSLKATLAFLSGLFSHRQWSLLEEHHERRVSPFIPSPTSDPALSVLDICVKAPAYVSESRAAGRPFSDATLVSSQGHASSDDTNISLFVNVPGFAPSEKDVTDAFRTGKSSRARVWTADQMDNDSYPSVLSARAGHRDPFPIFSTGSSSLPV